MLEKFLLIIIGFLLPASLVFLTTSLGMELPIPDTSLRNRGAVILLAGVLVTVISTTLLAGQRLTIERLIEILKEERTTSGFYLRLLGFAIALLGILIIFYSKAASILEEILVIIVMTNLFFYNVLRVGSK